MIEITSLSDEKKVYLSEQCDTCANDGKGADQCKINAEGKCNYMPVTNRFRCNQCVFGIEHFHPKEQAYSYNCSIGKFFGDCDKFVDKRPDVPYMPIDDKTISIDKIGSIFDDAIKETDKCRLLKFIDRLIPNDFKCNHFSLTFNDDDSASIYISNYEDKDEK